MTRRNLARVGIVGCGVIAQLQHIPAFRRSGGAEIVAICDRNEALMAEVGSRLGTVRHYNDFTRMLSQEDIDIIDICTPPQTHATLALEAALSGRHVLVEKPVALSLDEFDRVAEACTRNGVKLCQIQNKMFEPVVIDLASQVERGDVGDVIGVDIQVLSLRAAILARDPDHWYHQLPAGVLTEVAPHPIYLAQLFLGEVEPVAVYAGKSSGSHPTPADVLRVILKGERGVGVISWSGPATKDKTVIDITGTRKNLRVDLWNAAKVEYGMRGTSRPARALENLGQAASLLGSTAGTALSVATGRFSRGHFTLIRAFVESVREGKDPPVLPAQAREVIRVLEVITRMATATE